MDSNNNRSIDAGEMDKRLKHLHSLLPPRARWPYSKIDGNGDGKVTEAEWMSYCQFVFDQSEEQDYLLEKVMQYTAESQLGLVNGELAMDALDVTGLATQTADWTGNFLVVDRRTLDELGSRADAALLLSLTLRREAVFAAGGDLDAALATGGDLDAFGRSMKEAVYRAHAEALRSHRGGPAGAELELCRLNQGVLFRELFTGQQTFAQYAGKPFLHPIPEHERDRIATYSVKAMLENFRTGRWCSGKSAGAPPADPAVVKVCVNPQHGTDAVTWQDGWAWAQEWGAQKWDEALVYADPRSKSGYVYVRYDPAQPGCVLTDGARAELEAEAALGCK